MIDRSTVLSVTPVIWPDDLLDRDQWLTWKLEIGQGESGTGRSTRKIPRAPFVYTDSPNRYVDPHDPDHWTDFETASQWAEALPGHELAYDIADRTEHPEEDLVLLDYDDVRDPETGQIHPTVREHVERAGSYAAVSTSGTGVHLLGRLPDGFPDGVQTIASPLRIPPAPSGGEETSSETETETESDTPTETDTDADTDTDTPFPTAEIEGYCTKRFVGLTGKHIDRSPPGLADLTAFIADLCEEYATSAEGSPDTHRPPERSREELAAIEHTDEFSDVIDAIEQTRPGDIRLRSTVTNERRDSKDLDPSWARSASGTRLAQLGDGWIYRQGMCGLDALQVVALEEGLLASETAYPEGETFWRAVDALRDRGAHIPRHVSSEELAALTSPTDAGDTESAASPSDSDNPPSDTDTTTSDGSPPDDVVVALGGELALKSLRSNYTRRCPECASSVDDAHETACSLNSVPMMTINTAYETIIAQLETTPAIRSRLQREATGWGPIHRAVFDHLWKHDEIVRAGSEGGPGSDSSSGFRSEDSR
jgi:hypothetical protein